MNWGVEVDGYMILWNRFVYGRETLKKRMDESKSGYGSDLGMEEIRVLYLK